MGGRITDPRARIFTVANAHAVQKKRGTKAKKLPHLRTAENPATLAEYLATQSEFGGTDIERIADGAAHRLGFSFDDAQYTVQLLTNGSYTVIDRVLFHPPTAVYLDGIEHDLREQAAQKDLVQMNELKSLGWTVIRISYLEIFRDPLQALRRVLNGY